MAWWEDDQNIYTARFGERMSKKYNKKPVIKRTEHTLILDDVPNWQIAMGKLVPPPGRPRKTKSLFRHVAEKIPFEYLATVREEFRQAGWDREGVYIAHDSMGYARYVGRGHVFARLNRRYQQNPLELSYFSFYIIANKNHEREIETLMIRLGGAHLHFNSQKKRVDIRAGNIRDYEAGTRFIERRRRRSRSK